MKRSIQRTLANEALEIRIPVNRQRRISHIHQASAQFSARTGRRPDAAELAQITELSQEKIKYALDFPTVSVSIDDPVGENGEQTVADVLAEPEPCWRVDVDHQKLMDAVEALLSARSAQIVAMRYGLRDGEELSAKQIAERIGISKQRILQLLQAALATLNEHKDFAVFRDELAP
jgi:DNA-directed RNA polymerase sigma subunit (sigma70/sigma32)